MATKRKISAPSKPEVFDKEVDLKELDLDKGEEEDDSGAEDGDDESNDSDSSVYSDLEDEEDSSDDESDKDDESMSESSDEDGDKENKDKTNGETKNDNEISNKTADPATKVPDEYTYDSSDEEDIRNTIGNIPTNWYNEYDHIGYDLDGKKIRKPKRGDELDAFLNKMENPEHGVTVEDPLTGQNVVLSEKDADLIKRVGKGKVPQAGYDLYGEWSEWFSSDVLDCPVRDIPESKKSFLPSHWEKQKVGKMVHAIKMGWMKPRQVKTEDDETKKFYMLWQTDDQADDMRRVHDPIPAPKMKLPGHEESYNPPPEYLFTDKEKKEWNRANEEGDRKKLPFIPEKYSCLRKVPQYDRFIQERFSRCLDLYLAPRARKMRLTIQPEDLVPQLPRPQDLQPFPTVNSVTYKGHTNMVRTIALEPRGEYMASGSDDGTFKIWEISTGRCLKTWDVGGVVKSIAWCPNNALSLIAVAVESKILLINTGVGDKLVNDRTTELLSEAPDNSGYTESARMSGAVKWEAPTPESPAGTLVVVNHFKAVKQVTWHAKGDYFCSVIPEGANRSVIIHQLSKWRSQLPFSKSKGLVQAVQFHPIRPYLFVATQRHIRIYDLVKQELSKKLMTGCKWISSIDIHPGGDNLVVSTYDKRVQWFDLDLSSLPYQVLRYHTNAVRGVAYHKRYPLFASAGDDNNIVVSHGMVYNDLLQNPLIVPVKKLRGHTVYNDFGVMALHWHPLQPWLFSTGADGYIKLWT